LFSPLNESKAGAVVFDHGQMPQPVGMKGERNPISVRRPRAIVSVVARYFVEDAPGSRPDIDGSELPDRISADVFY